VSCQTSTAHSHSSWDKTLLYSYIAIREETEVYWNSAMLQSCHFVQVGLILTQIIQLGTWDVCQQSRQSFCYKLVKLVNSYHFVRINDCMVNQEAFKFKWLILAHWSWRKAEAAVDLPDCGINNHRAGWPPTQRQRKGSHTSQAVTRSAPQVTAIIESRPVPVPMSNTEAGFPFWCILWMAALRPSKYFWFWKQ
jgi:hypothetical protein